MRRFLSNEICLDLGISLCLNCRAWGLPLSIPTRERTLPMEVKSAAKKPTKAELEAEIAMWRERPDREHMKPVDYALWIARIIRARRSHHMEKDCRVGGSRNREPTARTTARTDRYTAVQSHKCMDS